MARNNIIYTVTLFLLSSVFALSGCVSHRVSQKEGTKEAKELSANLNKKRVLLPNGWSLSPAGQSVKLGDLPLNLAVSKHNNLLAATNNGYSQQVIDLIDAQSGTVVDSAVIKKSWVGLKFGDNGNYLYASGGNTNDIVIYHVAQKRLTREGEIKLGKPWPKDKISVAGLTVDNKANRLYAVTKEDSSLYICDISRRSVLKKIKLPAEAYTCILSPDGSKLYISLWGGERVEIYDTQQNHLIGSIPVESHPNDMAITKNGKYLFVANANSNSVSIINTMSNKVIENINAALYPDSPAGSTTNGVALSEDGTKLFIANADNNCLAVFDVSRPGNTHSLGFIPTGWYPSAVRVMDNKIFVANGKGEKSMPNPGGPNPYKKSTPKTQYIAGLFKGTLSMIVMPDKSEMSIYSQAVYKNTPFNKAKEKEASGENGNPIPRNINGKSPIKHVFYIIKENRTYDQVFGDIREGNGDSTLTLFGRKVTPNEHKLAKNFVLYDNFYDDAEVSADGHNWSTAAYATDYVEKTWPTYYSGRGGTYDYEGSRKIAYPKDGFIWNYCKRAGISYRSYGEFSYMGKTGLQALKGHLDKDYPGFDLDVMDIHREQLWEQDFDSLLSINKVPRFQTIRLPNDHTYGARLGKRTPDAYAADNDLALGRLIDHLSHSRIWKSSAIFILEDDAQNGPDHVDAHRSIAMVISPYVKRHYVDHTMYSTASMLRTMELILGLPPMSQYDAAATPMWRSFTSKPDFNPYRALPSQVDLYEKNTRDDAAARMSAKFDFSHADEAPDGPFNKVIWKAVKGSNSTMPAPRKSAFVNLISHKKGDTDD
jgi:YVTN family beta-propeller protein